MCRWSPLLHFGGRGPPSSKWLNSCVRGTLSEARVRGDEGERLGLRALASCGFKKWRRPQQVQREPRAAPPRLGHPPAGRVALRRHGSGGGAEPGRAPVAGQRRGPVGSWRRPGELQGPAHKSGVSLTLVSWWLTPAHRQRLSLS